MEGDDIGFDEVYDANAKQLSLVFTMHSPHIPPNEAVKWMEWNWSTTLTTLYVNHKLSFSGTIYRLLHILFVPSQLTSSNGLRHTFNEADNCNCCISVIRKISQFSQLFLRSSNEICS